MGTGHSSIARHGDSGNKKSDQDDAHKKLRRYERQSMGLSILIHEVESGTVGAAVNGRGMDISRSGMGICVKRFLHPGKLLLIRLTMAGKPDKLMYGIVRNVDYLSGGHCQIGVEFTSKPDLPNLQKWLSDHKLAA